MSESKQYETKEGTPGIDRAQFYHIVTLEIRECVGLKERKKEIEKEREREKDFQKKKGQNIY